MKIVGPNVDFVSLSTVMNDYGEEAWWWYSDITSRIAKLSQFSPILSLQGELRHELREMKDGRHAPNIEVIRI